MADNYKKVFDKKIASIVGNIPKSKATPRLLEFVQQFFAKTPLADIESINPDVATSVVLSNYEFIQQRKSGTPKIRIAPFDHKKAGLKRSRIVLELLNDDIPFLVSSISSELTRQGFTIYETIHPQLHISRDAKGKLTEILDPDERRGAQAESLIHLQISPLPENMAEEELITSLERVLEHVFLSVRDWQPMLQKCRDIRDDIATISHTFPRAEVQEVYDFMNWLCNKNFVLLGYVEYDFYDCDGKECLSLVEGSELGIYDTDNNDLKQRGLVGLPQEQRQFAKDPTLIEVTKAGIKSIIHRPIHMDYIAVKRLDYQGKVIGERRFLGMFTSIVYYQSADTIPLIRHKIVRTLEHANFDPTSHNGKALRAILEFFPRDELFQITEERLFEISLGVMALEARPTVGFFVRRDKYERFVSCMVYIPRDRFSTYIRKQIEHLLEDAFDGSITGFYTQLTDSPLARLHLLIKTQPGQIPEVDEEAIKQHLLDLTSHWPDGLRERLLDCEDEQVGEQHYRWFQEAFPKNYMNNYTADTAVEDILKMIKCAKYEKPSVSLIDAGNDNSFHLRIYTTELETPLSSMLPVLENMGCQVIEVHPYSITPDWEYADTIVLRDFKLSMKTGNAVELAGAKDLFEETLESVWSGQIESDGYNALVLAAGLSARQLTMLRTYGKYLKQAGLPYNEAYVAATLGNHPVITRKLVELFETRFSLKKIAKRDDKTATIRKQLDAMLSEVSNLAEDVILRDFADTILATLRTNFYQETVQGEPKEYISIKLNSANVPNLPLPRPYAEIFVYSVRMKGIHLRGGKVARGGLRWSDRMEDFRTEVLGLMKAQVVKNTVIVPVGSKGGFVVKNPPTEGGREAFMAEGIACYQTFLKGLLDVTDNIVGSKIIAPKDVICHDESDPYLVVAADKGTATFSDYANAVSESYGFWLGDAFASGGSVGYDHKKMGITAKGAWVSVMRHFREMGIDTQKEDFTTVAVGDMAGDVFGNGMLLSKHIRLVAAFNHRHIFIDPNPDSASSYKERSRLFKAVAGWEAYNESLISKGGGIYERSAKSIKLSKESREALDISEAELSPDQVIKHILRAEVDLLWNGGIGTYVKSRTESHDDVGDRANDSLRQNGEDLRCKVVGEGGNLGFTQLGRIEYAREGGRINTDAIDNSAGVDCSDHEVNIKIAFADAISSKKLSMKKRDVLLAEMTDRVGELVLRDNQLQTQVLTITEMQSHQLLEQHAKFMDKLEQSGLLNREVEFLPSDKEIATLRSEKQGMSRPELSVLLSYAKLALYDDLVDSNVPDSVYLMEDLVNYFPEAMQKPFARQIENHRLRREIIATSVTNNIVNRAGITFYHTVSEETGRLACDIARAYIITRDAFGLRDLWANIEKLDGKIAIQTQVDMFTEISKFTERTAIWFLRNCSQPLGINEVMENYVQGIEQFKACFESITSEAINKAYHGKIDHYAEANVPKALAAGIASLEAMSSACDIVSASISTGLPVKTVGSVYYEIGARLQLGWTRQAIWKLPAETHWDRLALKTMVNDSYDEQRRLTLSIIQNITPRSKWEPALESWTEAHDQSIQRLQRFINELRLAENTDMPMFFCTLKHVRSIAAMD